MDSFVDTFWGLAQIPKIVAKVTWDTVEATNIIQGIPSAIAGPITPLLEPLNESPTEYSSIKQWCDEDEDSNSYSNPLDSPNSNSDLDVHSVARQIGVLTVDVHANTCFNPLFVGTVDSDVGVNDDDDDDDNVVNDDVVIIVDEDFGDSDFQKELTKALRDNDNDDDDDDDGDGDFQTELTEALGDENPIRVV